MPILPLIDLLILIGSGCLAVGFVLKSIDITTHYSPAILGFSSIDFLLMTVVCLGFALTLAARTWVKLNEPKLLGRPRSEMWVSSKRKQFDDASAEERADEDFVELSLTDSASRAGRR